MADASTPRPRRPLDRRTLAICAVIALLAALTAALVTSALVGDDDAPATEGKLSLTRPDDVDVEALLGVRLLTTSGKATTLDDQLGAGRTLVNLWQSTCTPCIKEMPLLESIRGDEPDVTVIGIATQDKLEGAQKLAAQTKITYPWFQDPKGDLYYEAKGAGLPTTLLLASDGRVLATETGAFSNRAELQAFLDDHPG